MDDDDDTSDSDDSECGFDDRQTDDWANDLSSSSEDSDGLPEPDSEVEEALFLLSRLLRFSAQLAVAAVQCAAMSDAQAVAHSLSAPRPSADRLQLVSSPVVPGISDTIMSLERTTTPRPDTRSFRALKRQQVVYKTTIRPKTEPWVALAVCELIPDINSLVAEQDASFSPILKMTAQGNGTDRPRLTQATAGALHNPSPVRGPIARRPLAGTCEQCEEPLLGPAGHVCARPAQSPRLPIVEGSPEPSATPDPMIHPARDVHGTVVFSASMGGDGLEVDDTANTEALPLSVALGHMRELNSVVKLKAPGALVLLLNRKDLDSVGRCCQPLGLPMRNIHVPATNKFIVVLGYGGEEAYQEIQLYANIQASKVFHPNSALSHFQDMVDRLRISAGFPGTALMLAFSLIGVLACLPLVDRDDTARWSSEILSELAYVFLGLVMVVAEGVCAGIGALLWFLQRRLRQGLALLLAAVLALLQRILEVPYEVESWAEETFPRPNIRKVRPPFDTLLFVLSNDCSKEWLQSSCHTIAQARPNADWNEYTDELENLILNAPFSNVMAKGSSGIPSAVGSKVHTVIEGPMVLELVHMTEVGVSAFKLELVRMERDRIFYEGLLELAQEGDVASTATILQMKDNLPDYPRQCLSLYLSDGFHELQFIEYRPLPFKLGRTSMGMKLRLTNVPFIGGVGYLEPGSIEVLGGRVKSMELAHMARLRHGFRARMVEELRLSELHPAAVGIHLHFSKNLSKPWEEVFRLGESAYVAAQAKGRYSCVGITWYGDESTLVRRHAVQRVSVGGGPTGSACAYRSFAHRQYEGREALFLRVAGPFGARSLARCDRDRQEIQYRDFRDNLGFFPNAPRWKLWEHFIVCRKPMSAVDDDQLPRFGTVPPPPKAPPKSRKGALHWAPRKKPTNTNPLVHHGRHFGRAIYAFANVHALLLAGLAANSEGPVETQQERRDIRVFLKLLDLIPGLEERIMDGSPEEVLAVANMVQKGANSSRSDDTRSLKSAVIDWISPADGLRPPLHRNSKTDRGFFHEVTGALLCPTSLDWTDPEIKNQLKNKEIITSGDDWPLFLYRDEKFDSADPWRGLLRGRLLVLGYTHVFTSPSSVEDAPRATRNGNAKLHGMSRVTPASIAYVATQVRFCPFFFLRVHEVGCDRLRDFLSIGLGAFGGSGRGVRGQRAVSLVESVRTSLSTNDPRAKNRLRQIFPAASNGSRIPPTNSALSQLKARRAAVKAAALASS
ncbi:hypothetical protein NMY22_g14358 [Coprinellus aureogranulatus]|nr:hypothetical protein NMY22_g14358 [Coprinellus aureogranulatus]